MSRTPLGSLHPRPGHHGDVAQRRPADREDQPAVGGSAVARDLLAPVRQVLLGERLELLQVLDGVEPGLVDGLLPDDGVEEEAGPWHAAAGPGRAVALRIDDQIAALVQAGLEPLGNQHHLAPERPELPPALVLEPEHVRPGGEPDDIHAQRFAERVVHLAQHLVRLDHLHRLIRQPEGLAELLHHPDVHAGDRGCAQVHRDVVGGDPAQHAIESFPGRRHRSTSRQNCSVLFCSRTNRTAAGHGVASARCVAAPTRRQQGAEAPGEEGDAHDVPLADASRN